MVSYPDNWVIILQMSENRMWKQEFCTSVYNNKWFNKMLKSSYLLNDPSIQCVLQWTGFQSLLHLKHLYYQVITHYFISSFVFTCDTNFGAFAYQNIHFTLNICCEVKLKSKCEEKWILNRLFFSVKMLDLFCKADGHWWAESLRAWLGLHCSNL